MKKIILFFIFISLYPPAARPATPLSYKNDQKSDLEIVDQYLHPFNGSNTMQMEREILIRGPKPGIVKALCQALSEDPRSRFRAPAMLSALGAKQGVPPMIQILQTEERQSGVLLKMISSLGELGGPKSAQALAAFYRKTQKVNLADYSDKLGSQALMALGQCGIKKYSTLLKKEAPQFKDKEDQITVYRGLCLLDRPSGRAGLLELLNNNLDLVEAEPDPNDSPEQLKELAEKKRKAPRIIEAALAALSPVIQAEDQKILDRIKSNAGLDEECGETVGRAQCLLELIGLSEAEKVDKLKSYLNSEQSDQVLWGIHQLTALGSKQALEPLILRVNDPVMSNNQIQILTGLRKNGKNFTRIMKEHSEVLKVY